MDGRVFVSGLVFRKGKKMESTIEKINGTVVLTVQYEALDAKSAKDFRQEFDQATENGDQVLVDLRNVKFVDSAGLGAMVASLKRLRTAGGDMKICGVNKPVSALFELVRMQRLVEIFNNRDEALASQNSV